MRGSQGNVTIREGRLPCKEFRRSHFCVYSQLHAAQNRLRFSPLFSWVEKNSRIVWNPVFKDSATCTYPKRDKSSRRCPYIFLYYPCLNITFSSRSRPYMQCSNRSLIYQYCCIRVKISCRGDIHLNKHLELDISEASKWLDTECKAEVWFTATSRLSSLSLIQTISGSISGSYPKGTRKPTLCDKRPVPESNHISWVWGFILSEKKDR